MGCPIFQRSKLVAIGSDYDKESGRLYFIPITKLKNKLKLNFEPPKRMRIDESSSKAQSEGTSAGNHKHRRT